MSFENHDVMKKPLDKCTKAELISVIETISGINKELDENVDEMRQLIHANAIEASKLLGRIKELEEENENLWLVIKKGLDLKEILDDAEDIASDIAKAMGKIKDK